MLEKPIGHDLASARADQRRGRRRSSPRAQIFRIDHYLGKETVQNLMALRFANVAVRAAVERAARSTTCRSPSPRPSASRAAASYYDSAGALRDMVQNHMLQLLCLVAMEPPTSLDADAVRDEKLKVLRALRPIDGRRRRRA